jgi:hypothetical protein
MNRPDDVDPENARLAVMRIREESEAIDVDDEILAAFVDGGIDAVPAQSRASLLRAVGRHPEVASIVAELAATRSAPVALRAPAPLGISRAAWRAAWAACTLLSLGLTMWAITATGVTSGDASVLDGAAASAREPSFREWFEGRPLHYTIFGLWLVMCLLAIPSLSPSLQRETPGSRPRGSL